MSFTFDARRRATLTAVVDTFVASVPRDDDPTGFWAEELVVPHQTFTEAGWDVDIATPRGKAPTVDRLSLGVMGGTPAKRQQIAAYLDRLGDI